MESTTAFTRWSASMPAKVPISLSFAVRQQVSMVKRQRVASHGGSATGLLMSRSSRALPDSLAQSVRMTPRAADQACRVAMMRSKCSR